MKTGIAWVVFVCALCGSPEAWSAIGDEDRPEAQCANAYNTGDVELTREADLVGKNPGVFRFLAEGQWSDSGELTAGPRFDLDLVPVTIPTDSDVVTGLATGFSFHNQNDSGGWRNFAGELRLGLARRVFGIGWSTGSGKCKARRIDLRFDLLQWQVGAVQDRSGGRRRAVFATTLGFPGISFGYSYVNWGWKTDLTLPVFQLAPAVEFGIAAHAEISFGMLVLSARVQGRLLPDLGVTAIAGIGFGNR